MQSILPDAVTLGGAEDGCGASLLCLQDEWSRNLLEWVVGLQQRRRRLFVRKAEVAA